VMSRTAVGNSMVGSRAATRLHRAPKVPRYPHLEALLEGNPSPGSPNPPLGRPVDEGTAALQGHGTSPRFLRRRHLLGVRDPHTR